MFMMQDLVPGIPAIINSQLLISENSADGTFNVVEVELGLILGQKPALTNFPTTTLVARCQTICCSPILKRNKKALGMWI